MPLTTELKPSVLWKDFVTRMVEQFDLNLPEPGEIDPHYFGLPFSFDPLDDGGGAVVAAIRFGRVRT